MKKISHVLLFLVLASWANAQTTTKTTTTVLATDGTPVRSVTRLEVTNATEVHGQIAAWDKNHDGSVSYDEFTQGVFRAWDKDNNGEIILGEFTQSIPYWYAADTQKAQTFAAWDKNADGEVHLDELRDGIKATGLSVSFYDDVTRPVPVADFEQRVYSFWDTDRNGVVTVKEYSSNSGQWTTVKTEAIQ